MSAFTLDIRGQLNSMHLAESKALWPLFEAVVNSIQSIEDSPNKDCGKITIFAQREATGQTRMELSDTLERFESFSITDNGIGLDKANYHSFNTAYSTLKVAKGCKGIGRFIWLKAFDSVEVDSIYHEGGKCFHRKFEFSPTGIDPENNTGEIEEQPSTTTVKLKGFMYKYRHVAPVELPVVAKRIIEHCLPFFISGKCPEIVIHDGVSDPINLNQYFDKTIKDSLHQDKFSLNNEQFTIFHLRIPEGASKHELHFCANMQEVSSIELKRYIPDLQKRIHTSEDHTGFFYVGYVTGNYLDTAVNVTRTGFNFDETNDQMAMSGTDRETILSKSLNFIKTYMADYLSEVEQHKRKVIDSFVANDRPTYRYMLRMRPSVYKEIPAELTPDALELELHKQVQVWEREIKKQAMELEEVAKRVAEVPNATYQAMFDTYWANVTELSKTSLAEYVTRRKAILKMLDDALTIQDNGAFKKEDVIHSLICPMRHTSDEISFEEMNLWIVDERLAYHKYLASDKTLKSMPVINSNSTKEPDIAVFDMAFAYSDSDEPLSTVTIVEFKKPDNDSKNPINQVGEYIDLIRAGKKKKANGQSFSVTNGTLFRCYVICDLTDRMRTHCMNGGLSPMADNLGYTGFHQVRNATYEVISYNKLLTDAKKRNQILFDKLFEPKLNEVINVPE